jgi:hypothetical protein
MRPSTGGVIFILLVSIAFTALVALDVLGLVWLVFGPGAGAAAEIAASFYTDDGVKNGEQELPPPEVSY